MSPVPQSWLQGWGESVTDGCAVPEHPTGLELAKYLSPLALPTVVCWKTVPVPHQTGLQPCV